MELKYFCANSISDALVYFFLDVFFLLLVVILSENDYYQESVKIELQKKVHRRIYLRDITFLTAQGVSVSFFVAFFVHLPSLLAEWPQKRYILLCVVFSVMSKIRNSLAL